MVLIMTGDFQYSLDYCLSLSPAILPPAVVVEKIRCLYNYFMNSMKLVIPLHGVTALLGLFFHEIKCNGMTSFMELMKSISSTLNVDLTLP